jgi:hypothetical protein
MDVFTKDIGKMILKMGLEGLFTLMEIVIKDNGLVTKQMEKEIIIQEMAIDM